MTGHQGCTGTERQSMQSSGSRCTSARVLEAKLNRLCGNVLGNKNGQAASAMDGNSLFTVTSYHVY
ncbi:BZ3500_MvSof-1268-A1-R1_Chr4-1g06768 [Microbotryum saponariae]|uniref:BZ3500_MvSof-1268-A1-R1_Chr4-1g06753 protein n=1 Tax=Microbotryum saponariae TaxID=289078 RepID=A0A2X0LMJ0_9BASI|nr:BZ3500_MvSof-1268-A1-R1_Chr4-1g06753 [Microbotryum saponariae]SCZ96827.1 BZ3500_MvSof-1268-A1-R1_Chr4-1g06760 [Microbotryum saponariae]SCZ96835.1 BZ3500_MvSof-1268-A1-R1_Chr4-1g06768 [Microbotryum saponariae]SDA06418.1 BZ3501_MvSof-1269-A2-R1_Chr4-1g06463 [Microbotryum saponariae]SDA06425.1 BZ3501_MvSof-1269-A2-R1_Chr4-1g06470 [Microbotryum saponariae]